MPSEPSPEPEPTDATTKAMRTFIRISAANRKRAARPTGQKPGLSERMEQVGSRAQAEADEPAPDRTPKFTPDEAPEVPVPNDALPEQESPAPPEEEGAAPAPSAGGEDYRKRVAELEEVVQGFRSEQEEIKAAASSVKDLEKKLSSLANLSEVLSARYNPFLTMETGNAFAGDGIQEIVQTESSLPEPELEPPAPETGDEVPWDDEPADDVPPSAPADRPPRPSAAAPELDDVRPEQPRDKTDAPRAARARPERRPARPRVVMPRRNQAYLALRWFEYLLEPGRPELMYWFLDRFQNMGWIAPEDHAWLIELAEGIAPRPPSLAAPDDLDPRTLVRMHHQSLRFLEQITGDAQSGEAWPGGW